MISHVATDFTSGSKAGLYDFRSLDVAVRLLVGAMVEGIKGIIEGAGSRAYIEAMASMVLRSLGVAPKTADKAAAAAARRLHREAPRKLAWWQAFD
jgi:hypothetical protein